MILFFKRSGVDRHSLGSMLDVSHVVSLSYYLVICVALRWIYLVLTQFWWMERGSKPELVYKSGSKHVQRIVQACSTLRERYVPPFLWGKSGHIQTLVFGAIGRFLTPHQEGERHSIILPDGSTVYYDIFEPEAVKYDSVMVFVCPGIGNSSETDYVRGFTHYARQNGHRVAVFNHVGALKDEKLTGGRMFTYGGTGDIAAVFEELCQRYPATRFIGIGFSLGACVLVRFLGEDEERQKKFICAASVCQGYDPTLVKDYMRDWSHFRRFYNYRITTKQVQLVRRHSQSLLSAASTGPPNYDSLNYSQQHLHRRNASDSTYSASHHHKSLWTERKDKDAPDDSSSERRNGTMKKSHLRSVSFSSFQSPITHDGHDCNGYSLDSSRLQKPKESELQSITSMIDFDESYSRRVLGFSSVDDMYKWVSCVKLMYQIKELPILITNALDDPLVMRNCHEIPEKYTEFNQNALFVRTEHGGHLGYFEGGVIRPKDISWIDRLLLQYADACIELSTDEKMNLPL